MRFLAVAFALVCTGLQAQYWQQHVDYTINVNLDVKTNKFTGNTTLVYTNNSPDTLKKAFFHLYFNAFQPHSMMDTRSRNIADPDGRVRDRIVKLKEEEYGHQHVTILRQDGTDCVVKEVGTILEVKLPKPILPGAKTTFTYNFNGQVPLQVRRSGRDNKEGIRYSMSQWYPKISEYDRMGWHANPYVGREFHGVWGDFKVNMTLDSSYMVAGTGVLQNASEIGKGYLEKGKKPERPAGKMLTWRFKADNVHDFVWAADPDYVHTSVQVPNGPVVRMFYQPGPKTKEAWEALPEYAVKLFTYASKTFGKYPYPVYSVIQGGDGGMEYPMATLVTGERAPRSLVGVTIHEAYHSWFQCVLATNESLYPWMDEGFTSYATSRTVAHIYERDFNAVHFGSYAGYRKLVASKAQEPLTTHADHFDFNGTYGISSYSKGAIFLHQLSYIIGQYNFDRTMLAYFDQWKFKHPNPVDFIRVAEKISGMELDWYLLHWVGTTKVVDYAVGEPLEKDGKCTVTVKRIGGVPMPMELWVELEDGSFETYYAAPRVLRGEKENEYPDTKWVVLEDWPWTHPEYNVVIPHAAKEIKRVFLDRDKKTADVTLLDNSFPQVKEEKVE